MLHVTNGEVAASRIRASGLPGEVLSWVDVLHEGPVPSGLTAAELREVRADFISQRGWAGRDQALLDLTRRDATLDRAAADGEVTLWFEHDLFDQLHLIDLLDRLSAHPGVLPRLGMICIDRFPGVDRFFGLGQLEPEQIASLWDERAPVTEAQLELGRAAWAAFRSPDPAAVEALLAAGCDALPLLAPALRRHLEEFPHLAHGLSRTERQILEGVVAGLRTPTALFRAMQDMEVAPFMGDSSFWHILSGLAGGPRPLIASHDGAPHDLFPGCDETVLAFVLTNDGEAVREARADWIALRGGIDRWLGGVHLEGRAPAWRWDPQSARLVSIS